MTACSAASATTRWSAARATTRCWAATTKTVAGAFKLRLDADNNDATGSHGGFELVIAIVFTDGGGFDYADVLT
jgi:hypothetical protein